MKHRFINEGFSPIPMGSSAEYMCVCGRRDTRAAIDRHIAEAETAVVEETDDFGGGDTKAHYLPIEPRKPAPTGESPPLQRPGTPDPLPPPPTVKINTCPICANGSPLRDLPEIAAIAAWSCGHWIQKRPRAIAETFQEMLRATYDAGARSVASGETFEGWYQREVLQA